MSLPPPRVRQVTARDLQVSNGNAGQALAGAYNFPLVGPVTASDLGNGTKYEGQHEYIVQYLNTGGISGISSASSPQRLVGPPASSDAHDALALPYLLSVGVPSAELGPKHSTTSYVSNAATAPPSEVQTVLHGYKTVYERVVAGFSVPESHAAVELNSAGVPVTIDVEWPTIPDTVLSDAQTLATVVAQGWSLPPSASQGLPVTGTHVIIKHSPGGRK